MSESFTLVITLESDSSFASDLLAGDVDIEIEHDDSGLPIINGRTIKGLLVNECAELLAQLGRHLDQTKMDKLEEAATKLFGEPGTMDVEAQMTFGEATIAPDLAAWIEYDVEKRGLSPDSVFSSLTGIRRQTANDPVSGAPKEKSLRGIRVLTRGLQFFAPITTPRTDLEKGLLGACVMILRRGGLNRNRGLGKIKTEIWEKPLQPDRFATEGDEKDLALKWYGLLKQEVGG